MAPPARVWAVVPAAGLSRRMGVPKLALPYRESTVLGTVVQTLLDAELAGIVVVTRPELIKQLALPDHRRLFVVPNNSEEMIDSIRVGLRFIEARAGNSTESASPIDGVLVTPADMPEIDAATIRACVLAFAADIGQIVIAAHRGKCGHPMVFPFAVRHAVSNLEGGLRELPRLYAGRVTLAEVGDEGIQADIDTWTEYVQACRDSLTSSV